MPPGEKYAVFAESVEKNNKKFLNKNKQNIYCYYWKSTKKPRALLLISHGFTEHCMMYDALAEEMARRGFFVFAHDHAGHGHSEGPRAFFNDLHDLVEDSFVHVKMVREEYPDLPLFICGHSMGGSVSVLLSLEKEIEISGIVLIAPALASNPETATFLKVIIAKAMSKFIPHFPLGVTDFGLSCQNKVKVDEMTKDPLRHHGFWKARPLMSLLAGAEEILKKASEMNIPFFVMHGDADKICHIDGSTKFYEQAKSSDKTLKVYTGAQHSLLNEPDDIANDVFDKIVAWLEERGSVRNIPEEIS